MKMRSLICFTILTIGSSLFGAVPQSPMLVVLLMVKDEHQVIIPTLDTYLSDDLKAGKEDTGEVAYIIYDTGSTDGTQELAEKFFDNHKIKHHLIAEDEWIDFAPSRNKALAIAREKYPESTFILFPDAEWYMHGFEDLLSFCRTKVADYQMGEQSPYYYRVRMKGPGYWQVSQRLFLTADDVEFVGAVHECVTKYCEPPSMPPPIYFEIGHSKFGYEKSRNRWYRDRNRLRQELQEDPSNSRTVLYLGQTEYCLGHYHIAYMFLKRRTNMPTFPQEDYFALYMLAEVTEQLSYEDPEHYNWDEALGYYMKCYEMRPQRAEPLVKLADHYLKENKYALSYLFAKRAVEIPMPDIEEEALSVGYELYDYYRWEILSRAAWYVEDYELGEQAAKKAIEARPNDPHLYRNLSFYWERNK